MIESLLTLDARLFELLRGYHSGWLDVVMTVVSTSGVAGAIWFLASLIGLVDPMTRASAFRLILCLLMSSLVVELLMKPAFERNRPPPIERDDGRYLPTRPRTLSFPSGHTSHAVAAAVGLSRVWPQARVAWWALAALMGYTRIYVGHHYPSDVLGGAAIGVLIALWVLGGRNRATYSHTLPRPREPGAAIRP